LGAVMKVTAPNLFGEGMKHKHNYSGWVLSRARTDPKVELSDKDYIASLRFSPMWMRACECGFEEHVRMASKPSSRLRFSQLPKGLM